MNIMMTLNRWRCEKKSCVELKIEMDEIQQQMEEDKKKESAKSQKEVKGLCKKCGFTAGMLKKGKNNEYRTS